MKPKPAVERIFYLDCVRAIAIILVVFIHVSGSLMRLKIGSFGWLVGGIYDALARPAVPLFLMISGALLLTRYADHPIREFFKKKFFKILVPLVLWSIIYLFFSTYYLHDSVGNYQTIIKNLLGGGVYFHLGFFYYLIALYLTVPFLAPLLDGHEKQIKYFLIIWFVFTSIASLLMPLLNINLGFATELFTGFLGIFILGYALHLNIFSFLDKIKIAWLIILSFIIIALTLSGTYWLSLKSGTLDETFFTYISPNIVILSLIYFLMIKKIDWKILLEKFSHLKIFVKNLSEASFGIYLIHPMTMAVLYQYFGAPQKMHLNPIILIPFLVLIVLIVSWAIIALIKKLPVLKILVP